MTQKRGKLNVTARILLKILILLLVPLAFLISRWGTITLSSHFLYASFLFQISSPIYGGGLIPDVALEFIWNSPLVILSLLLVALPAILFNLYLLRSSKVESLGRITALVVVVTVSLDVGRTILFPEPFLPEALVYPYSMMAYFPWVLTILVFMPLLFRQISIFALQKKRLGHLQHRYLRIPPGEWFLALVLGIAAVFASPFLYTAFYGGSMYGMFSAVGTISYSVNLNIDFIDISFAAYPSQIGLIFFPMLILGYVFVFQVLRYCGGKATRTSTILIGLLSWAVPYAIFAVQFLSTSAPGQNLYPFPILLMLGGLVLLLRKPLEPGLMEELERMESEVLAEPGMDEKAPEVAVPLIYRVWSKLKTSRLNPLRN